MAVVVSGLFLFICRSFLNRLPDVFSLQSVRLNTNRTVNLGFLTPLVTFAEPIQINGGGRGKEIGQFGQRE
jgi:hypothetical protein